MGTEEYSGLLQVISEMSIRSVYSESVIFVHHSQKDCQDDIKICTFQKIHFRRHFVIVKTVWCLVVCITRMAVRTERCQKLIITGRLIGCKEIGSGRSGG